MISLRPWSVLLPIAFLTGACVPPPSTPASPVSQRKGVSPNRPNAARVNGRGKVSSISLTDFFERQQAGSVLLYDARPAFFYALGHIPGAISLPKTNCDAQIVKREVEIKAALAAHKTIVIYCTNLLCPDARTVAIHMADAGYSTSTLTGGWESYKETGLPTE
jgi:3-mercaptopyruvate sulfurtransferase SseA